jgi:RNA polymerase sigma-70 factor (ECF subfamily)
MFHETVRGIGPGSIEDGIREAPSADAAADFVAAAFAEHHDRVYRLVFATTRDEELAADVVQEAFVRLLVEVRAGRAPENTGGWLYRAASNLVVSRARRAAVARRLAPRLVRRDDERGPEDLAIEHERSRVMEEALARVSTQERIALVMAAQGSTGEEIAAYLGKTHGATRTMMSRARARLHAELEARERRTAGEALGSAMVAVLPA